MNGELCKPLWWYKLIVDNNGDIGMELSLTVCDCPAEFNTQALCQDGHKFFNGGPRIYFDLEFRFRHQLCQKIGEFNVYGHRRKNFFVTYGVGLFQSFINPRSSKSFTTQSNPSSYSFHLLGAAEWRSQPSMSYIKSRVW